MSTAAFITLVANVGRIDATKTFGDRQLATFSVAVSRKFKAKGETVEETDWYTIKANTPQLINMIEKHINKGDQLIITGAQSIKTFDREGGEKGTAVEIFAHAIQFNISKKSEGKGSRKEAGKAQHYDLDDEIPF